MTTIQARQKIDRGVKRRCTACDTLFYDLMHNPIRCPKCGVVFNARAASPARAAKRFKATVSRTGAKKAAVPVAKSDEAKRRKAETEGDELERDSEQDDLILDQEEEV